MAPPFPLPDREAGFLVGEGNPSDPAGKVRVVSGVGLGGLELTNSLVKRLLATTRFSTQFQLTTRASTR